MLLGLLVKKVDTVNFGDNIINFFYFRHPFSHRVSLEKILMKTLTKRKIFQICE